ncbi:hypothetical protein [uncultured Halopseudomonas sp.]|uniref:hypothetical protein n=1 Tax=uncultured Halopseudomonas sp. TaxID=2901193 RepID=UPI0030EF48DC|tara:strand:- start:4687 stop:4932 length:246 start_codon:yes stop_codon:yes gene_type:complete
MTKDDIDLGLVRTLFRSRSSDRWVWLRAYVWQLIRPALATAAIAAGLIILFYALGNAFGAGLVAQLRDSGIEFDLILQVPE